MGTFDSGSVRRGNIIKLKKINLFFIYIFNKFKNIVEEEEDKFIFCF